MDFYRLRSTAKGCNTKKLLLKICAFLCPEKALHTIPGQRPGQRINKV